MATSARPGPGYGGAEVLARQPKAVVVLIGWGLILLLGWIDYWLGAKISLSAFHLIPIAIVSWFVGRGVGIFTCVVSALVWLAAQVFAADEFIPRAMRYWGSLLWLFSYITTAFLLSELRRARRPVPGGSPGYATGNVAGIAEQQAGPKKSSAMVTSPSGPLVLHVVWQQSQQRWAYWVSASGLDSPHRSAADLAQARSRVLDAARSDYNADISNVAWRTSLLPAAW